jgi:hypothetical protein
LGWLELGAGSEFGEGQAVGEVQKSVKKLSRNEAAGEDEQKTKDESKHGGAQDAGASLVGMREAEKDGRNEQASPNEAKSGRKKQQEPGAIEKFLTESGGERDKNPKRTLRRCGGKKTANAVDECGEFRIAGFAGLLFPGAGREGEEHDDNGGNSQRPGTIPERQANIGKRKAIAAKDPETSEDERP